MKVEWLTPERIEAIDPTGRGRVFVQSMKVTEPTPVPRIFTITSRDEWLQLYKERRAKIACGSYPELLEWDQHYESKYGAQGDGFALSEVQEAYRRSYDYAERPYNAHYARMGRDYLIARIRDRRERVGYPQLNDRSYNGRSAALPSMAKKGSYVAETLGFKPYRHVMPMLPGQRSQRNGHRVINQEANPNFRYFELELNAAREWLKTQFPEYFSGWLNPDSYMNQQITRKLSSGDSYSVELDYTKCDEHFSFDLTADIILPIYEELIPSTTVFIEFAAYIEELFHQELFFGDYLWTGKHNLFSGQGITNDFETIYDVCLQLGALIALAALGKPVLHLACGDDQTVVHQLGMAFASELMDVLAQEARLNGHEINMDKCAIRKNAVAFCKRLYARGVPHVVTQYGHIMKGMYPSVLTLNAVVNPEKYHSNFWEELVATLQRCDNLWGSPWYEPVVQLIGGKLLRNYRIYESIPETAAELDWWDRLYGKRWHKSESQTVAVWRRSQILL